jgi:predicted Zn-dependent protease with MMP-like domain
MSGFCIDAMNQEEFAQLVTKAIEDLPQEFLARLENVDIVIEDYATPA